ncbi:hypothetical protein [Paramagnetospirillum magneticum]|uniref:Broad-specificity ulvan lyase N-terminal domain-containing protein n=1 Tax=Paramagnetospirillum magneticum (strain ATCC 700264 / AMB-1) TaxID=342108 RepID=Q2WB51_PARM1|nr:hypothetical protein [Paramagnetospirillum magneticum]BAE48924.1 hypothetical protein amb0120 [Paramagnetospirillum magneticum AMB-1]
MITSLDAPARRAFYRAEVLRYAPRLLSQLDRCPLSAAAGSADREYWAWATKDFANQDMQRGIRVLAYLFANQFPGNPFAGQPAMLAWIERMVGFWSRSQSISGAFDHLYLNENSWMAAAFTLVDMAGAFDHAGSAVSAECRTRWLETMRRAAVHLVERDEEHAFISNHRAAGAAGLLAAHRLMGDESFRRRGQSIMDEIYRHQSPEGWYAEYGGADPGYQTLDTHYQGLFYRECGEARVLDSVSASIEFLSYFAQPDGSVGGEYGSRACPHFFPGGFEVFASHLPLAEALAGHCVAGLALGKSAGLSESDCRNEIPMATSYVVAMEAMDRDTSPRTAIPLPLSRRFERAWSEAGMMVRNDGCRYTIIGASKGGTLKVFDLASGSLVHSSCGYAANDATGRDVSTHLWTLNPDYTHGLAVGENPLAPARLVTVRAPFFRFHRRRLMSPLKLHLFRLFNMTAGRIIAVNNFVRRVLIVGQFISGRHRSSACLTRVISFGQEGGISISDRFDGLGGFTGLREYGFLSTVYMASAKYFRPQDMSHEWVSEELDPAIERVTDVPAPEGAPQ